MTKATGVLFRAPDEKLLHMDNYVGAAAVAATPAILPDYFSRMPRAVGKFGNTSGYPNCTLAAPAGYLQAAASWQGKYFPIDDNAIISAFLKATNQSPLTDKKLLHGWFATSALGLFSKEGLPVLATSQPVYKTDAAGAALLDANGKKILSYNDYRIDSRRWLTAYAAVRLQDEALMRATYFLLGPLPAVIMLDATVNAALSGPEKRQSIYSAKIWNVTTAPGLSKGLHEVLITHINDAGPRILTWGYDVQTSWAWWFSHVREQYGLLSTEFVDANLISPSGHDFTALKADVEALRR